MAITASCSQDLEALHLQGVIFVCSANNSNRIAEQLGCPFYTPEQAWTTSWELPRSPRQLLVPGADRGTLTAWQQRGGLLVMQSSQYQGLNLGQACFVMHVGIPANLLNFAFELGHMGSSIGTVKSVVVASPAIARAQLGQQSNLEDAMLSTLFPNLFHDIFPNLFHNIFHNLFHNLFPNLFPNLFHNIFHNLFPDIFPDLFHNIFLNLFHNIFLNLFHNIFRVLGQLDITDKGVY
ncbi:hypothetical protein DV735_g5962, partial [Chaetothyriales sp. CBS 134920]